MKKTYEIIVDDAYFNEPEDYLKYLMCENLIVVNNGWWNKEWPKDKITLSVICNDVFAWGCSDAEDINYSDLEPLAKAHLKDPTWGVVAWCIKKRKQMPQKPIVVKMTEAGYNLEELIGEEGGGEMKNKQNHKISLLELVTGTVIIAAKYIRDLLSVLGACYVLPLIICRLAYYFGFLPFINDADFFKAVSVTPLLNIVGAVYIVVAAILALPFVVIEWLVNLIY